LRPQSPAKSKTCQPGQLPLNGWRESCSKAVPSPNRRKRGA